MVDSMSKTIFTVTGVCISVLDSWKEGEEDRIQVESRPWGFANDLDYMYTWIEKDKGGLSECKFDLLVVEEYDEGIRSQCVNEWWYKLENDNWVLCDKPKSVKEVFCWAFG